ncbi:winged helix-turn-helix domain-containing tetratricopeptide repeat protein [Jannaschia seohaensis]|uniref:TolB amino-terminal domain-containing protein n=1 Tax=Jannaschia seohaensis TaxID=475081 RepID=A0A2Y9B1E6_9RHOB|nr:winged helix-turn-helix domain-containing protein [Jannaschia seohaensis]PWJ16239.1 TolB-like protein [Jannaschia seohaensis]SSA49308.1 TolB amino-terminal domain-containing protein [Jannaschia seohaensis]
MALEISEPQRLAKLDGREIALGARAFDVLAYLFAHSDRVVSKAELLSHVWSDLIVEEGNLSVQIAALRKALGKERIKTVPGIGYRLIRAATSAPPQAQPDQPSLPSIPSLAVLPFTNLTGSAEQDYLVDGIVTEVISALSRVSGFFVISSTSTFTYKGRSVDLAEVGQELGVRYVLEGSIQTAGNRIRIFTQLVEAESGHTLWQERFDGTDADIFDLQDEVAQSVAGALEPKLQWAEVARAQAQPTENLAAYDLCLRATPLLLKLHAPELLDEGLALLDKALALDPDFIQAHALYAYSHTSAFATRWWSFEKAGAAEPHARRVLDSDTDDALALAYAGHYIAYLKHAYREGLTALERAERLNPNSGTVQMLLGWVHTYINDCRPAITHLERAKRLSPLHPHIGVINGGIGNAHLQMGETETAIRHLEQAVTEYPEFASNQLMLIGAYWSVGRKADAKRMADHLRRKVPDMTVDTFLRTRPHHGEDYNALMVDALRGTGFPD